MNTKSTLGAAALTGAAAAAAYYLYGSKNATQHRRDMASFAKKAEREIVREAKALKDRALTDENITSIAEAVAKRYRATRDLDSKDVREFVGSIQHGFREAKKRIMGTKRSRTTKKSRQRAPKSA